MQLWHVGRVSHPSMQPEGQLPVSASAIGIDEVINTPGGHLKMVTPRALTVPEIKSTVEDYANAARLAMEAGFDGVEIHSANSYLLEQFLHSSSNIRTDAYGGSIENRCRLVFEVVEAVISEVGAHRTGIRLSPSNIKNGMDDPDPVGLYGHLVCGLNRYGLAYLHLVEPMLPLDNYPHMLRDVAGHFRKTWKGILISCGNYDYEKGLQRLASGDADMIAYGRLFIANPDLPERFRKQAPLNVPDPETFYYGGNRGYLDYPFMDE